MLPDVHFYVPLSVSGSVHIHLGEPASEPAAPGQSADLTAMINRIHKNADDAGNLDAVLEGMVSTGWGAYAGTAKSAYVRLVYRGSAHRVSCYLNSASLSLSGPGAAAVVAIAGADPRGASTYFNHRKSPESALAAADALRAWCDGAP